MVKGVSVFVGGGSGGGVSFCLCLVEERRWSGEVLVDMWVCVCGCVFV